MATLDQAIELLEDRGWNVELYPDYTRLGWYSPKGEDWSIETYDPIKTFDDVHDAIYHEYQQFDVDEHVDLWAPGRGTNGIPSSYAALVYDAEQIEKELHDSAVELVRLNMNS